MNPILSALFVEATQAEMRRKARARKLGQESSRGDRRPHRRGR